MRYAYIRTKLKVVINISFLLNKAPIVKFGYNLSLRTRSPRFKSSWGHHSSSLKPSAVRKKTVSFSGRFGESIILATLLPFFPRRR